VGLRELEKRLEQEPDNLGLRVMVAGAMREAGRHTDANALYRSVALAYRDQGRMQQAIMVCKSALADAPDDPRLRELLAQLSAPEPPPRREAVPIPVKQPLPLAAPPPTGQQAPRPPVVAIPPLKAPSRPSIADETPLPRPVPYHVHDPTSSLAKFSLSDMPTLDGDPTSPGSAPDLRPSVAGIASAARKISKTLSGDLDASSELDTRKKPLVAPGELERLAEIDEDATTPVPREPRDEEELTNPRDHKLIKHGPLDGILFAPLPVDRRGLVFSRFYRRTVKKSGTVIRQGETGHPLVLVSSGRLEVRTERANGTMAMLEAIGENEFIGETSLLARTAADANVVAIVDSELLLLSPHDFFEIAGAFPSWWAHLKQVAERRARDHERRR
jgi:hypothetical protein